MDYHLMKTVIKSRNNKKKLSAGDDPTGAWLHQNWRVNLF